MKGKRVWDMKRVIWVDEHNGVVLLGEVQYFCIEWRLIGARNIK